MTVNNEIGVAQPIKEIGKICREHKVLLSQTMFCQRARTLFHMHA